MNKKGQKVIVMMMIGIVIFIAATLLVSPIKQQIDYTMNESNMNCSNPSISNTDNAVCIISDMSLFYFISMMISMSVAVVAGRKKFGAITTSIVVFVITSILISPLKIFINQIRGATYLNCTGSISIGARLTCMAVDIWLFWFILTVVATALTYIFVKMSDTE